LIPQNESIPSRSKYSTMLFQFCCLIPSLSFSHCLQLIYLKRGYIDSFHELLSPRLWLNQSTYKRYALIGLPRETRTAILAHTEALESHICEEKSDH